MFDELYKVVTAYVRSASVGTKTVDIHSALIANQTVRRVLEIEAPEIEDVSDLLALSKGKVFAVRMDKAYGIIGFKKPVMASLILKRLIESGRRDDQNKKWIDGGNVNSALALAYYAKKFNGDAAYVMSRFFPNYVLDYIQDVSNRSIHLIKAPNLSLGIERDFYQYLVEIVRSDRRYKSYQPLWHAKHSGAYTQFLGHDLADKMRSQPDYIVTVVGAGSTLEGQAIPIRTKFNGEPKIVVPEHFQSPLLDFDGLTVFNMSEKRKNKQYPSDWFSRPPEGIPHYVIGPHYQEMNPLIKKEVLRTIESVFFYDDDDWKQMSYHCYQRGMSVGNSSAANLVIAKRLAEEGNIVLTFVYEPFRSIYRGHNVGEHDVSAETHFHSRADTLGQFICNSHPLK